MAEHEHQANTGRREPACTVLNQGSTDPLPLKVGVNGQGREDGRRTGRGGASNGHRREENMPNRSSVHEAQEREVWLSCWIVKQRDDELRFILLPKCSALDSKSGVEVKRAGFNDIHVHGFVTPNAELTGPRRCDALAVRPMIDIGGRTARVARRSGSG